MTCLDKKTAAILLLILTADRNDRQWKGVKTSLSQLESKRRKVDQLKLVRYFCAREPNESSGANAQTTLFH